MQLDSREGTDLQDAQAVLVTWVFQVKGAPMGSWETQARMDWAVLRAWPDKADFQDDQDLWASAAWTVWKA